MKGEMLVMESGKLQKANRIYVAVMEIVLLVGTLGYCVLRCLSVHTDFARQGHRFVDMQNAGYYLFLICAGIFIAGGVVYLIGFALKGSYMPMPTACLMAITPIFTMLVCTLPFYILDYENRATMQYLYPVIGSADLGHSFCIIRDVETLDVLYLGHDAFLLICLLAILLVVINLVKRKSAVKTTLTEA